MGKELSEIEDDYRTGYELAIEQYRAKLKTRKNGEKARQQFKKTFEKLLEKRNKEYARYVSKNKEKLLGMPEKKAQKNEKFKVYHAHHIDFRHGVGDWFKHVFHLIGFKLKLFFRSVKYNIIPSWLKYFIFRLGVFFSSIHVDVNNFFRGINHGIVRVIMRYYERVKEKVLEVYNKYKAKYDAWVQARKEALEAKKQKEEEEKQKAEEESQKKKDQHEAAMEKLKEIDNVLDGKPSNEELEIIEKEEEKRKEEEEAVKGQLESPASEAPEGANSSENKEDKKVNSKKKVVKKKVVKKKASKKSHGDDLTFKKPKVVKKKTTKKSK